MSNSPVRFQLATRTTPSPGLHRARSDCRSALAYWLRYAFGEPRDFAYSAPRRIACHLFGRHNLTCVGRPAPHPRRW